MQVLRQKRKRKRRRRGLLLTRCFVGGRNCGYGAGGGTKAYQSVLRGCGVTKIVAAFSLDCRCFVFKGTKSYVARTYISENLLPMNGNPNKVEILGIWPKPTVCFYFFFGGAGWSRVLSSSNSRDWVLSYID